MSAIAGVATAALHRGGAARGGVSIWLGGISLGGLLALDYAASYPDESTAVLVRSLSRQQDSDPRNCSGAGT
jgi:pimeloyl-ACP methyl ester carboxylesterase